MAVGCTKRIKSYSPSPLFPREEWCGRGQSLISTYFRADKGKNRVSAFLPHCPCSKEFCCSGNHNNRRPGMDRDQAIHLEASQGLRFWKSWVGRSDPGRGGLILPLDTFFLYIFKFTMIILQKIIILSQCRHKYCQF